VNAFLNTVPSEARRSMFGVGMSAPKKLNAPAGHWSVRRKRMFFIPSKYLAIIVLTK
jgi:hypothetical protein